VVELLYGLWAKKMAISIEVSGLLSNGLVAPLPESESLILLESVRCSALATIKGKSGSTLCLPCFF
jgi:hypothetical protein